MKNCLIFYTFIFLLSGCIKESNEDLEQCIENGVIICQKPLWKVPFDNLPAALIPLPHFEDKVIVGNFKDNKFGIRCMKIETGEILWEQNFDVSLEYLIIQDTYFNVEQGFLILKIGSWGGKEHFKIDIYTGEILWKSPIESFGGMEAFGDHYYCTVISSGDVHQIYKVNIETGQAEYFCETDLPPHPDYNAQRTNSAFPFEYNGKEYLFISEMQMTSPNSANFYYSLMEATTKERLLIHVPIENAIEKVEKKDGAIYVFTQNGYKIFNMETLLFEKEVKLISRGDYMYHIFYKDLLILGLSPIDGLDANTHFVINLQAHTERFSINDNVNVHPSSVMDDILYFVSSNTFFGYNINTGKCVLKIDPSGYETSFCTSTYKNSTGKKFVIVGDTRFTYCYKGI